MNAPAKINAPPTFDFNQPYLRNHSPIMIKFSGHILEVSEGLGCEFHWDRTRPWVRFLPLHPARLFSTIRYLTIGRRDSAIKKTLTITREMVQLLSLTIDLKFIVTNVLGGNRGKKYMNTTGLGTANSDASIQEWCYWVKTVWKSQTPVCHFNHEQQYIMQ